MAVKRWMNTRQQFLDGTGAPYSGGKLHFYAAGTTTEQDTFNDSGGATANPNPIVLDSAGRPSSEVWLTTNVSYKVVLKDSSDSQVWEEDNIEAINDVSTVILQWIDASTPTYISGTQFSVAGDQTTELHVNRRVKVVDSGGTKYGTITASAYTTLTTVTVELDSGSLATPMTSVAYGIIGSDNTSFPTMDDERLIIADPADATKQGVFDVNGVTAGQKRVMSFPDKDGTLALLSDLGLNFGRTHGLIAANNSGTPNTQWDMDCKAVQLYDDTNNRSYLKFNPGSLTCNTATAGPAANGRDQAGAFSANAELHFFYIYDPTNDVLATIVSETGSPDAGPAAFPTDYTAWAYAGTVEYASSVLEEVRQYGSQMYYEAQKSVISNQSTTSETDITSSLDGIVPSDALSYDVNAVQTGQSGTDGGTDTGALYVVSGKIFRRIQVIAYNQDGHSTTVQGSINGDMPNTGYLAYAAQTITNTQFSVWVVSYRVPNGDS